MFNNHDFGAFSQLIKRLSAFAQITCLSLRRNHMLNKGLLYKTKLWPALLGLGILLILGPSPVAASTLLYDATLSTLPSQQGWLFVNNGTVNQSVTGGHYVLDTHVDSNSQAGNSRNLFPLFPDPVLDTTSGFSLDLTLRVVAEEHSSNDRAGFSLLFVGQNPRQALELAFWANQVWAYDYTSDFTHGPTYVIDTTDRLHNYGLQVQNGFYQLFVDGVGYLNGSLVDYTPAAAGAGFFNPRRVYGIPNLLFFGDDTSRAGSQVEIAGLRITPFPLRSLDAVPTLYLLLLGGLGLVFYRRNQRVNRLIKRAC